jgi:hypothetical protein
LLFPFLGTAAEITWLPSPPPYLRKILKIKDKKKSSAVKYSIEKSYSKNAPFKGLRRRKPFHLRSRKETALTDR